MVHSPCYQSPKPLASRIFRDGQISSSVSLCSRIPALLCVQVAQSGVNQLSTGRLTSSCRWAWVQAGSRQAVPEVTVWTPTVCSVVDICAAWASGPELTPNRARRASAETSAWGFRPCGPQPLSLSPLCLSFVLSAVETHPPSQPGRREGSGSRL